MHQTNLSIAKFQTSGLEASKYRSLQRILIQGRVVLVGAFKRRWLTPLKTKECP